MSTPSPTSKGTLYVLHLRPLRSDVPAPHRVRRLLKLALRDYGLKCVDVQELPAQPDHDGGSTR